MTSDNEPVELKRPPEDGGDTPSGRRDIWMRGLWMILFALFFGLAESVLLVVAVVQFFWMLFAGQKNAALAEFGVDLGKWLRDVARFQSGASENKPFPWARWGETTSDPVTSHERDSHS